MWRGTPATGSMSGTRMVSMTWPIGSAHKQPPARQMSHFAVGAAGTSPASFTASAGSWDPRAGDCDGTADRSLSIGRPRELGRGQPSPLVQHALLRAGTLSTIAGNGAAFHDTLDAAAPFGRSNAQRSKKTRTGALSEHHSLKGSALRVKAL